MSEWISVKDRLPEVDKPILALFKLGSADPQRNMVTLVLKQIQDMVFWKFHLELRTEKLESVSHWMNLPSPPKEPERSDESEEQGDE